MSTTLIICYARSGGTLLNRCLGSLPNTIIMSEVNPTGGGSGLEKIPLNTIKQQAKIWYGINLKTEKNNFEENFFELEKICRKKNKNLIIRDWSFVNFNSLPNNNYNPPNKLLSHKSLKKHKNLKTFAFVRNAIDVYLSRGGSLDEFSKNYLNYVKEIKKNNIPVFKYENFCEKPEKNLKKICKYIGIEFSKNYKNFLNFKKVNGDIQNEKLSRGIKQKGIKPLKRKWASRSKIKKIEKNKELKEANDLLGYSSVYSEIEQEKKYNTLKIFIKNKLLK